MSAGQAYGSNAVAIEGQVVNFMSKLILKIGPSILIPLLSIVLVSSTTGCGVDHLSVLSQAPVQGAGFQGKVHGGQQPIAGAAIKLWAVGSGGYGSQATNLLSTVVTTSDGSGAAVTAWSVASNVAVFTVANTYTAGQTVTLNNFATSTFFNGQTVTITAATSTQFAVSFTHTDGSATEAGAANISTDTNANASNLYNTMPAGFFTITGDYTCAAGSELLYITASGGNPGGASNNNAIMLATPLGACGTLLSNAATTFITINEVTTAAAAFALGQYFTSIFGNDSTDSFGAPNTPQAQTGISNAFATVNNLVSTSSGTANTLTTLNGSAGTINVIPSYAKLYTIANILAACVNSTSNGSSCSTLFADVTPTNPPGTTSGTATPPTDTLQAAVYMSLNPTSTNTNTSATNITALYGLATGVGAPFTGGSKPTDWTITIQYQDPARAMFYDPKEVAIDSTGNVWAISTSVGSVNGELAELSGSAPGVPLFATNTINGISFATYAPRNVAIDTDDNVWFTTSTNAGYIFEVTPSGTGSYYKTASNYAFWGLAINRNNDVFASGDLTSAPYEVYEFPAGNIANPVEYPVYTGTGICTSSCTNSYLLSQYMAFDTNGNLWMANGQSTTAGSVNDLVQLSGIPSDASIASGCISYPCMLTDITTPTYGAYTTYTGYTAPWSIAATSGGSIWIANAGSTGIYQLPSGSTTGAQYASGISTPQYDAVDGAGNVWVSNNTANLYELNSNGTLISPATGFSGPQSTHPAAGVAIDPSGNVWVASNSTNAPSTIYEIVGVAAPTVTPIARALKFNAVATKPLVDVPSQVGFVTQPADASIGTPITPAITVAIEDSLGNTVTSANNSVTLSIGANPGSGLLSGTLTATAVNGIATFSGLSINAAGTGYTLAATSTGLAGATSGAFTVFNADNRLVFTVSPADSGPGTWISPTVAVSIEDGSGNIVPASNVPISLAIGINPVGGILSGIVSTVTVNGVATFSALNINTLGSGYTLIATTRGLSPVTSPAFNIVTPTANINGFYMVATATVPLTSNSNMSVALANNSINGAYISLNWNTIEPVRGQFDWSQLDAEVALVAAQHKKVSLAVVPGEYTPAWVYQAGAAQFNTIVEPDFPPDFCAPVTLPLPWDSVYLTAWTELINAFGAHYANNPALSLIKVTGVSYRTDETSLPWGTYMNLPPNRVVTSPLTGVSCAMPDDVGQWQADGYTWAKVDNAFQQIVSTFKAAFPNIPLGIMTSTTSFPPLSSDGLTTNSAGYALATTDFFTIGRGLLGTNFVGQNNGLKGTQVDSGVVAFSSTNPTGYQMAQPVTTDPVCVMNGGVTPCPAVPVMQSTMNQAIAAHAHYIEVFYPDVNNPAFQNILIQTYQSLNSQ